MRRLRNRKTVFAGALFGVFALSTGVFPFVSAFLINTFESYTAEAAEALYNSQTLPLLRAAQNVDPNPAKGGGDITIIDDALLSEEGPNGTLADIEEEPASSDRISLYVVRGGDSLSQIADMFGVSSNTIRWANDISRGVAIQPGDTLVILPISGIQHTVKDGDTLKGIAKKYDGDLEEILEYNGFSIDTTLAIGDVVVVPDGEISTPVSSTQSYASAGGGTYYTDGYYTHPLPGALKTQGLHGYNGLDFGAAYGTSVIAAATGDVIIVRNSGWNGGYGNYIVIRHANGTQTLYSHNSQNIVYAGQSVVQGQVIGYVGMSGRATGAHLHFEVRGARNPF